MKIFTVLFVLFMLVMAFQRIGETFFAKKINRGEIYNKWTFPVLSTLHFIVGIGTAVEYFCVSRNINYTISCVGFCMFVSAFILRRWAVHALGDYHSIHIEIRTNQPLIKNGPYYYLRHPYYLSVILELLGLPLVGNAFFSFAISLFVYIPFLLLRVYLEEQAMITVFNGEYIQYKKDTPGFFPLIKLIS